MGVDTLRSQTAPALGRHGYGNQLHPYLGAMNHVRPCSPSWVPDLRTSPTPLLPPGALPGLQAVLEAYLLDADDPRKAADAQSGGDLSGPFPSSRMLGIAGAVMPCRSWFVFRSSATKRARLAPHRRVPGAPERANFSSPSPQRSCPPLLLWLGRPAPGSRNAGAAS